MDLMKINQIFIIYGGVVVSHRAGVYVWCCGKVSSGLPFLAFSFSSRIALSEKKAECVSPSFQYIA